MMLFEETALQFKNRVQTEGCHVKIAERVEMLDFFSVFDLSQSEHWYLPLDSTLPRRGDLAWTHI